jgi:hypothetical protein
LKRGQDRQARSLTVQKPQANGTITCIAIIASLQTLPTHQA